MPGPATMAEVWVVTNNEDGHVYGLANSEIEAWDLVAREARTGMWEGGCENLPAEVEGPDDLALFWLIRARDGSRERELIVSAAYMHDITLPNIWGVYRITPTDLPEACTARGGSDG